MKILRRIANEKTRIFGGGRGIRTPESLSTLTVFKTAAFNRSAIPPSSILYLLFGCGALDEFRLKATSEGFGRMWWLAGGFYSRISMEGVFPSLLSPLKQFTVLLGATDLPNSNPFKINFQAADNPVSVSKTARLFQVGKVRCAKISCAPFSWILPGPRAATTVPPPFPLPLRQAKYGSPREWSRSSDRD